MIVIKDFINNMLKTGSVKTNKNLLTESDFVQEIYLNTYKCKNGENLFLEYIKLLNSFENKNLNIYLSSENNLIISNQLKDDYEYRPPYPILNDELDLEGKDAILEVFQNYAYQIQPILYCFCLDEEHRNKIINFNEKLIVLHNEKLYKNMESFKNKNKKISSFEEYLNYFGENEKWFEQRYESWLNIFNESKIIHNFEKEIKTHQIEKNETVINKIINSFKKNNIIEKNAVLEFLLSFNNLKRENDEAIFSTYQDYFLSEEYSSYNPESYFHKEENIISLNGKFEDIKLLLCFEVDQENITHEDVKNMEKNIFSLEKYISKLDDNKKIKELSSFFIILEIFRDKVFEDCYGAYANSYGKAPYLFIEVIKKTNLYSLIEKNLNTIIDDYSAAGLNIEDTVLSFFKNQIEAKNKRLNLVENKIIEKTIIIHLNKDNNPFPESLKIASFKMKDILKINNKDNKNIEVKDCIYNLELSCDEKILNIINKGKIYDILYDIYEEHYMNNNYADLEHDFFKKALREKALSLEVENNKNIKIRNKI